MTTNVPIRRIAVALDASPQSIAALDAAAQFARVFGAELAGVFVEDENLFRAAALPFAREVGRLGGSPGDLTDEAIRLHFRAQARRAADALATSARQHGIAHSFRVVRGHVLDELIAAADGADLIAIGQAGTADASRRKFGTIASSLLARTHTPVLLLRRGIRLDLSVVVVYDCKAANRDRALHFAARLARKAVHAPLVVLVAGAGRFAEVTDRISAELDVGSLVFVPVSERAPEHVVDLAGRHAAGLIVVPADTAAAHVDRLQRLVSLADVPVLIVGG